MTNRSRLDRIAARNRRSLSKDVFALATFTFFALMLLVGLWRPAASTVTNTSAPTALAATAADDAPAPQPADAAPLCATTAATPTC